MPSSITGKISHQVIKSLYNVLAWYMSNPGTGKAPVVIDYYKVWKSIHALTVNISSEAWNDICTLARGMNILLSCKVDEENPWLFLFAVETYLHIFIRAVTLSKLGLAAQNLSSMQQNVISMRNVFTPSVFEWVFEAYNDQQLSVQERKTFVQSVDFLLQVIYNLNIATLSVDIFRELYQNILPKSLRRSLGEFYTNEKLVDEVLDAVGLDVKAVVDIYNQWRAIKDEKGKPVILDPACGSGTFLIRTIKRLFNGIKAVYDRCVPDIAQFIEDVVIGIDINPFAVEMAKLNIILAMSEEMEKCGMSYIPRNIRIYWADSLAVVKSQTNVLGSKVIYIKVPTLTQLFGKDGELPIPLLPGMNLEDLINRIREAVRSGKDIGELIAELKKHIGEDPVKRVENELKKLYNIICKIEESGNARLIEIVKNASIVVSLLGNCNYVIGNPPWVRIHRVAPHVMNMLRQNYEYYKPGSAYNPNFKKTKVPFREQHDYSLAFVERGLQFLRDGGVLGYVITSKILKAMYAGKMREDIINNYEILELRDYSLYPIPLFQDAVNYPLILSVKKNKPNSNHLVKVTVVNTVGSTINFCVPQSWLPLDPGDKKSPWLIAPPKVISAFRKLQAKSLRLGDVYEVHMGVKTSADEVFVVKRVISCRDEVARVQLASGDLADIEIDLLHIFTRGRDISPFNYEHGDLIVFTHDTKTFEPLWNAQQKKVLELINVLKANVEVDAAGGALVYTLNTSCDSVAQSVRALNMIGFTVQSAIPCAVHSCFNILYGSRHLMRLSLQDKEDTCKIYVEGLEIPGSPNATQYFNKHLQKLVKRDDYKSNLPPWAIFRVSPDKFKEHRIAWQEIAKHFEACILPLRASVHLCDRERDVIVVPDVTVYFIVEPDPAKALKLLVYLNSDLARNMLKLRAWTARGGYYRHQAASVAHLMIPRALLECKLWKFVEEYLGKEEGRDLNKIAREVHEKYRDKLISELVENMNITKEEYDLIVEYGKWLNELGVAKQAQALEVVEEELKEGEEE